MTTRTAALATLGCKTNQFESAAMRELLEGAGYRIVTFEEGADLVIVNTCTVTSATDAQSRNLIRRARRKNPTCRVVVTGCYAQIDPDTLAKLPGVSVVIGNEEKKVLLDFLGDTGRRPVLAVGDISLAADGCVPPLTGFADRSRAYVQIQNGCDLYCTFCIIPHARGPSRSVPPEVVRRQVSELLAKGFPEIVLTGIHIGGFGLDLEPPTGLVNLVRELISDTGVRRLRLGSMEPTEIPDALIDLVAASEVVCPHFHVPLQSGDDSVLARMGRPYGRDFFRDLVLRMARTIPDAAIGLDVITGFPGETEAEFDNTIALIEDLPVSYVHVFPFSPRPGTPAAAMDRQIPGHIRKDRAERVRSLGYRKQQLYAERFIGRELELVVETGVRNGLVKGVSRNYLAVSFPGDTRLSGRCVRVEVTGQEQGSILGRLTEDSPPADNISIRRSTGS